MNLVERLGVGLEKILNTFRVKRRILWLGAWEKNTTGISEGSNQKCTPRGQK